MNPCNSSSGLLLQNGLFDNHIRYASTTKMSDVNLESSTPPTPALTRRENHDTATNPKTLLLIPFIKVMKTVRKKSLPGIGEIILMNRNYVVIDWHATKGETDIKVRCNN
jgi:hypothetical protein